MTVLLDDSCIEDDSFEMTWVKICGTTNLEDALVAVEAGADAVGFIFYEKSQRNITVEAAREIVEKLPENVEKVGVFVGELDERVCEIAEQVALTGVQRYVDLTSDGDTTPRRLEHSIGLKEYLALQAEQRFAFTVEKDGSQKWLSALFLDAGTPQQPGGTGTVFDWDAAAPLVESLSRSVKVVVAGGLNPTNVGKAIQTMKPWGVDVASGVEARPGKKDAEKVRAFVKAVREIDRKTS